MAAISANVLLPLGAIIHALCVALPAQAQHMNAADAPCRAAGNGVEQANCLSAAAKKVDADLNEAYQRIISVLDAAARQQL